jgi:hypothetical protein
MTLRRTVGMAMVALCAALAVPLMPVHVFATPACSSPAVSDVSPHFATPNGATITVSGTSFTSTGCTASVTVGGTSFGVASVTDTQLQFKLTGAANGAIVVTLTDPVGQTNASPARIVFVTTPTVGQLPSSPTVGAPMQLNGSGLTMGGQLNSTAVNYAAQAGSCPLSTGATVADTQVTVPALGQFCKATATLSLTAFTTTDHTATVTLPAFSLGGFYVAPVVTGLSASHVAAGSSVQVRGSGFGSGGSATVGGMSAGSSWSDTSVAVAVPSNAINGTAVALTRGGDGVGIPAGNINVDARVDSVSPSSASVGDTITINGGGFGNRTGTVTLGNIGLQGASWSPTTITATIPHGVASGSLTLHPVDTNAPASPPSLTVLPKITGITPTHATQGSLVEIMGTTFGTQQGSVSAGGQAATVTLWGDEQVLVNLPNLPAGPATVTMTVPGAPSALTIGVTIDPGATPGPGGSGSGSGSGSSSSSGASPAPLITPNPSGPIVSPGASVPFDKPKQSGPVQLNLSTPSDNAAPGSDVTFTVTLAAFDKPLVGAPVELVMVVEPGTDASITPSTGVSDATGKLTGTIHLSKTAGDHIVLARSGQYSDEIRVVGNGDGAVGSSGAAGSDGASGGGIEPSQRLIIAGALVLCLVLFVAGFVIQIKHAGGVGRKRRSRDAETAAVPTTPPQA